MTDDPAAYISVTSPDAVDLEQALTMLAWSDPAVTSDPSAAFAQLGVQVPAGHRAELTWVVKGALGGDAPRLIEVPEKPVTDS